MAKEVVVQEESLLPKGRKVYIAQLHQPFHLPGVTASTLYEHNGIDMVYAADGVYCVYKGELFVVPHANIIVARLTKPRKL